MFNWLSQLFASRLRKQLRPVAPHIASVALHNQFRWQPHQGSPARVYQQSPWVYLAINRIAEAGALVPLRVLQQQGEAELEVECHPLEQLLDNPNPTMSRFELFEQTIGMLELTGNAYWFLTGKAGIPEEIWTLRPDRITIVPDPQNFIRGYIYEVDGQRIPLEAVEVVHFKRWHPSNDYYGLSPLEAARLAIRSDRSMAEWNDNTFGQDKGVPAGIVSLKKDTTDTDYERIKRELAAELWWYPAPYSGLTGCRNRMAEYRTQSH